MKHHYKLCYFETLCVLQCNECVTSASPTINTTSTNTLSTTGSARLRTDVTPSNQCFLLTFFMLVSGDGSGKYVKNKRFQLYLNVEKSTAIDTSMPDRRSICTSIVPVKHSRNSNQRVRFVWSGHQVSSSRLYLDKPNSATVYTQCCYRECRLGFPVEWSGYFHL